MNLVKVSHLSFSYQKEESVLNDISFTIESGSYTSLIGHNGSGKSTIAKILIGLLSFAKGEITAFGLDYSKKNIADIRKHIGIVFQNPDNQFIGSTVKDDIAFGLENREVPTNKMDEIILEFTKKVHMDEYLDKEPEYLSGGQKQRVAIAGVLAMHPDLIILDEATAMLDPKGKSEIFEVINELRKENPNLAILSITHDIEEAFKSDHIIVLNKGSILMKGSPSELLNKKEELLNAGLDIPFMERFKDELKKNNLEEVIKDL